MRIKKIIFPLILINVILSAQDASAFIFINEILADPPAGLVGDANGDGISSIFQDEFVELLNFSTSDVYLSRWSLSDALKTRHTFPVDTIVLPYEFLVVFGGGNPSLTGQWQVATTGTLGLNNTGDQVTLLNENGEVIDQVIYGSEGNFDQSLVRFPEGEGGEFLWHASLSESQGRLFSPGTTVDGRSRLRTLSLETSTEEGGGVHPTVPEPLTLFQISAGSFILFLLRKKKRKRERK